MYLICGLDTAYKCVVTKHFCMYVTCLLVCMCIAAIVALYCFVSFSPSSLKRKVLSSHFFVTMPRRKTDVSVCLLSMIMSMR